MGGLDGSGGLLPDPFSLPYGGYDDVLAYADPGAWWRMLSPGARGHGLFVAFHMPHLCCHRPNGFMCSDDVDTLPVLLPVPVTWASGLLEDGTVSRALDRDWEDERPYAPIVLTGGTWPDDRGFSVMRIVNTLMPEKADYDDDSWMLDDLGVSAQGVVPPWHILPITEDAYSVLLPYYNDAVNRLSLHVLALSNCERYEYEHEDDSAHRSDCRWTWPQERCSCGLWPPEVAAAEAVDEALFYRRLRGDQLVPHELEDAWTLAQMNYVRGFALTYERLPDDSAALARGEGDPWSTSYWRRLSPFSDSVSLETLRRRLSADSTSSQMLLVS